MKYNFSRWDGIKFYKYSTTHPQYVNSLKETIKVAYMRNGFRNDHSNFIGYSHSCKGPSKKNQTDLGVFILAIFGVFLFEIEETITS